MQTGPNRWTFWMRRALQLAALADGSPMESITAIVTDPVGQFLDMVRNSEIETLDRGLGRQA